MRIGKNMEHALRFALKYPGWFTFNHNQPETVRAIKSLEKLGLVRTNKFNQFRARDHRLVIS